MTRPGSRPWIPALALVGALLLAGTGGAVAGGLVTGAQVEDGSLTGADVRDGSLTSADLDPGTSARSRSGSTVKGLWSVSGAYPGNGAALTTTVTLPRPAPKPLKSTAVLLGSGPAADAACTGTTAKPTAPRGKVCVYGDANGSVAYFRGFGLPSRLGFYISVQGSGQYLNVDITGSWAYTAR